MVSSSLALLNHQLMTYLITLMFSLVLIRLACVLNFILYYVDLLFNVNQVYAKFPLSSDRFIY